MSLVKSNGKGPLYAEGPVMMKMLEVKGPKDATGLGIDRIDADILDIIGEEGESHGLSVEETSLLVYQYGREQELMGDWPIVFAEMYQIVLKRVPDLVSKRLLVQKSGKPSLLDTLREELGFPKMPKLSMGPASGAKKALEDLGFTVGVREWVGLV